ncbi:MAG: putative nucleotidyltransferase substrate binding domain-containing protein [Arcobacteraceae bacterium]|jgi:CBS domain-containing protein|nr:putative nucleotidyltransferase substrate binding domain-containing protein [Arcobacteraceae bacterium]
MSLRDQESFLSNIHPFEVLTQEEMSLCIKNMDIAYYPKDTTLISPEKVSKNFFIIIKGTVHEYNEEEMVMDFHQEDSFDANSLIYGKTKHNFKVYEDLICYELNKEVFLKLIEQNSEFKNFFLNNLVNKIQELKNKEFTSELSSFMIARVDDTVIHESCVVDVGTKLIDAIEKSMEYKTSTIIVRNGLEYGIITDSLLKMKVLLEGRDLTIPVEEIAIFPLISVQNDDYLFDAFSLLIKNNIKRIGVKNSKGEMIGVLEQIDVLSHFANHTYVVDSKIKKAKTVENLKEASCELINTIKTLNAKGVKVHHISNLIGQLNLKVYRKLYQLVVPKELQKDACFIVMGSEGRNEQIIKTDQDNALVVCDNVDVEQYRPYMNQMTEILIDFGYPRCEGNIMVSNPFWCKTVSDYKKETAKWIEAPDMQNYMDLAIFFDSFAVAGNKELLINLKDDLFNKLHDKDVFMAYFARATLTFETPSKIANFMTKTHNIDIKKTGVFPIVQGIRSLALRERIRETTTIKRIKILEQKKILDLELASELLEAFDVLNTLRLKSQLQKLQDNKPIDNLVDTHTLGKIERDLLKDSFSIVTNFKKFITYTFKIDKIS